MYLEHDDAKLTIMGVPFSTEKMYQATMNAVVNNMYEGWKPTVDDIKMAQEAYKRGKPFTAAEILQRIRARKTTK